MPKLGQSRNFLDKILGPLLKPGLPLIKNILKFLAKSMLKLLGLTWASSDLALQKKIFGSGLTTLKFWNEEMNYIKKIFKSVEESCLLIKEISKTI